MDKNKGKYFELLESINQNALHIKNVGILMLKKSLKKKTQEEKMTFVAFSLNILFSFIDEVGKFYLIEKQYPNKINNLPLKNLGFYDHNKKIEILNSVIRNRQGRLGKKAIFMPDKVVSILRTFKDTTLHIDYKNGKILKPSDSTTIQPKIFENYINLIGILSDMMKNDLSYFKLYK